MKICAYLIGIACVVTIGALFVLAPQATNCDIKNPGARFQSFTNQLSEDAPKTFMANGKVWIVMTKDYYDKVKSE